jgi:peptidyl-prolyl cis-trans isomerase SurA
MTRPALILALVPLLLGGCAVPGWVPFLGTPKPTSKTAVATPPPAREPSSVSSPLRPGDVRTRAVETDDDISDRVVAVVNNDAITLGELQESIVGYRQENRQRDTTTDEELAKRFLSRLIDSRLQLQEAEREKIVIEDSEVAEELADRIKRYGVQTQEEFERLLREQGLTLDSVRKRLRDSLRIAKVVRRKVALRVSVTDQEIERYLAENRTRLETGLVYHARHILVTPEGGPGDAAWEAARIKADLLRTQLTEGADFAEVAKAQSKDASARDGGDLGTMKRGELAQEIETEILKLEPGQISQPFRSPLGYHLFRLESKESLEGEGLARAKQQIREILFRQKYDTRLEAWLREIKQRAIIEVRM